jgi:hypothetical protein
LVTTELPTLAYDTLLANLIYTRPDANVEDAGRVGPGPDWPLFSEPPDGLDAVEGEGDYCLSSGARRSDAATELRSQAAVRRALRETLRGRTMLVIETGLSTVCETDELLAIDDGRWWRARPTRRTQFAHWEAEGPRPPPSDHNRRKRSSVIRSQSSMMWCAKEALGELQMVCIAAAWDK